MRDELQAMLRPWLDDESFGEDSDEFDAILIEPNVEKLASATMML